MTFSISGWVRKIFRDASMEGIRDTMKAITPDGEEPPATVDELRAMLASAIEVKALAARTEEPEGGRKKK